MDYSCCAEFQTAPLFIMLMEPLKCVQALQWTFLFRLKFLRPHQTQHHCNQASIEGSRILLLPSHWFM
jgi:hypothetical protein